MVQPHNLDEFGQTTVCPSLTKFFGQVGVSTEYVELSLRSTQKAVCIRVNRACSEIGNESYHVQVTIDTEDCIYRKKVSFIIPSTNKQSQYLHISFVPVHSVIV